MAKKKEKKTKFAVIGDESYEITGENGRYWVCGDRQFRKASVTVKEVEANKEDKPIEE